MTDPIAAADAVVAAVEPGLQPPGVQIRDAVLVTGPWLAGTTSVLTALQERLPDHTFVEAEALSAAEAPSAVLFVVSAAAPITESDCALLELAAHYTDLVIGVVSKIDAHQDWREVLETNRATVAGRSPRFARMAWVGVAAAPDLGEPILDDLVELLSERLADPDVQRRNRLRAWEARLGAVIARHEADAAGEDRRARVQALHARRDEILRERRMAKSERTIALRSQLQQARVQLAYFARNRCTSVRAEWQEDVAEFNHLPWPSARRRRLIEFEFYVRSRAGEVVNEVDDGITTHLRDMARELDLPAPAEAGEPAGPELPGPPLRSRQLENRLMMLLGAGFGVGVAAAASRLFSGLSPTLTAAGMVVGGLVALAVTVWMVGLRNVLQERAVLDRWVGEVAAALRSTVEELVATRVLAAERELTAELANREEEEGAAAAAQIAEIDAELREHATARARAAAIRDSRVPILQAALDAVRAELYGPDGSEPETEEPEETGEPGEAAEVDETDGPAEVDETGVTEGGTEEGTEGVTEVTDAGTGDGEAEPPAEPDIAEPDAEERENGPQTQV